MKLITPELEEHFKSVGDQSASHNPIIVAKFFDPVGSATWYATEYDKETNICYGYVTGLIYDEWGSFSIGELESVKRPFGLTIERDINFIQKRFHEQFPEKKRLNEIDKILKEKNQEHER